MVVDGVEEMADGVEEVVGDDDEVLENGVAYGI